MAADRELYFVLDAAGRLDEQIGFVPAPVDIADVQVQSSGRSVVVGVRGGSLLVVRLWP